MIADDIPFIIKDIKNEMPFHNDNAGKIPYSFKAMPKSFMGESHKVDNKFLNNHLGEIEEAVDKKLMEKNSFIHQQVKYHQDSGILNHDNFFHADLATGCPISYDNFQHLSFLINPYTYPVPCVNGDERFVAGSPATTHNSSNTLYGGRVTTAQADRCYDQIAISTQTAVGSNVQAMYTDDPSTTPPRPDALISETPQTSQTTGWNYVNLPEWQQDSTANVWCAYNNDSTSNYIYNLGSGSRFYTASVTWTAMPDPFTIANDDSYPHRQKITHS
tara:strand:- start:36 stop:857 length:822 start_codon:yes stop_codon:yes gene_type:complete